MHGDSERAIGREEKRKEKKTKSTITVEINSI